ncbi:MAG: hypothetical protein AB8B50_18915 [Pirellulaceae bacterium]
MCTDRVAGASPSSVPEEVVNETYDWCKTRLAIRIDSLRQRVLAWHKQVRPDHFANLREE